MKTINTRKCCKVNKAVNEVETEKITRRIRSIMLGLINKGIINDTQLEEAIDAAVEILCNRE